MRLNKADKSWFNDIFVFSILALSACKSAFCEVFFRPEPELHLRRCLPPPQDYTRSRVRLALAMQWGVCLLVLFQTPIEPEPDHDCPAASSDHRLLTKGTQAVDQFSRRYGIFVRACNSVWHILILVYAFVSMCCQPQTSLFI